MEKTNKAKKPSWFKELKAEFNRIIWPTKERIAKETAVVVICAIIIGVIVAVLDCWNPVWNSGIGWIEVRRFYGRGKLVCCSHLLRL